MCVILFILQCILLVMHILFNNASGINLACLLLQTVNCLCMYIFLLVIRVWLPCFPLNGIKKYFFFDIS